MVHFIPLCSGSSGNAAYLGTQKEGVLIDAGSSCKAILAGLSQSGIESSAVRAILITHEHSDHIKALKVLCKKLPVPVWSMPQTLSLLERWEAVPQQTALFALEDEFVLAGMRIHPFSIEHDAVQPVGFRFELGERTVGFATDLGVVTDSVRQQLTGCDLVMLEANYEPSMLSVSPYPYHLKQRVASRLGHLSNIDAAHCLAQLVASGTSRVVLGHLSRENNAPVIASQTVSSVLLQQQMQSGRDYLLAVAARQQPTPAIVF